MKSSTIPVLVEITFVLSTPAQVPGTGLRTKKAHLPSMDALGGCVTCAILPVAVAGSTCTMVLIVACMISIASSPYGVPGNLFHSTQHKNNACCTVE
jgi:hypothetical protein